MNKNIIYIFALGALGEGISGGDRIFIEFARRWSKHTPISIHLWTEGYEMCKRQNLDGKNISYKVSSMKPWKNFGFFINYIARIFEGVRLGFSLSIDNNKNTIVYNASDFWMDTLPCFVLKLRSPKIKWIASWYQTAPNPFKGYAEGKREDKYRFKAFLYWLSQLPVKPLVAGYADYALVNNEDERKRFPKLNKKNRLIVVIGAIDTDKINKWRKKHGKFEKVYDAVFQGRFHPQKGVVELIDIWKKVVNKKKDAKLTMIGDGPLMENVKLKIRNLKLQKNIDLLGYVFDGDKKYTTFSQSKLVVHPALYDSGGMASAEAMAFELPVVGFDLAAYKSYYPKGMVRVETGNLDKFSKTILDLLNDNNKRNRIARDAVKMLNENWSWDTRAEQIYSQIT